MKTKGSLLCAIFTPLWGSGKCVPHALCVCRFFTVRLRAWNFYLSRLSIFLDSQLNRDWTICTRMTRNTTVIHMTEVTPRW